MNHGQSRTNPEANLSKEDQYPNFFRDLVKIMVIPNLINKPLLLYFGSKYSEFPGEGWGYGVAGCITYFLVTVAIFLWRYRGVEDP